MKHNQPASPTFWGAAGDPVWPFDRPAYDSLGAAVQGEAARHNVPGMAIGILQDGHIDIATAGFANLESKQPVAVDTIFQIGSISKVYTATLAQLLVQEGLLDLDAPVTTYLPDLELSDADATKNLTTRHLLSHTSGIEGDRFTDYGLGDDALTRSVTEYNTLPQWYQPGELFAYSNTSVSLAGRVLEVVAGKPFEQVMQERLLNPLGVPNTVLFTHDAIVRDHAVGHNLIDRAAGPEVATPYAFSRQITPAGNIVSSVADLLRFARLHLNDGEIGGTRILRADLAREMRQPTMFTDGSDGPFGIGWGVTKIGDQVVVAHGGATNGFRAQLTVLPDRGFAVAILANGDKGSLANTSLVEWALERYRGITQPKPDAIELPTAALEQWIGTWERPDRNLRVDVVDGTLTATLENLDPALASFASEHDVFPLEPLSETKFRITETVLKGTLVEFIQLQPDAKGNNRDLVRFGGRLAERLPESAAPEAEPPAKPQRKRKK